jgi:hypothetical protein
LAAWGWWWDDHSEEFEKSRFVETDVELHFGSGMEEVFPASSPASGSPKLLERQGMPLLYLLHLQQSHPERVPMHHQQLQDMVYHFVQGSAS